MIKYTPQHFLVYGILIYLFLFFFGPYSFEIRNVTAIIYLLIAYILWFVGIKSAVVVVRPKNIEREKKNELSDLSELVLSVIGVVLTLVTVIYVVYYAKNILALGSSLPGDTRLQASNMPFIYKLIQYMTYVSVGVYIIVSYSIGVKSKFLLIMSKIGLIYPVAVTLIGGSRWTLFVVLLVFWVVECTKDNKVKSTSGSRAAVFFIICVLLVICFILFATRGVSKTYVTVMPYYGTVETKAIWNFIGNSALGKPIYSIMYYFSHSVPYYAQVFELLEFENLHLGTYMFRIIGFFFSGFPDYAETVKEIPELVGSYSTFITGFMRDFGYIGTLMIIFFFGRLMGIVNRKRKQYKIAQLMHPYFLVMCILSPLYYSCHVGGIDFMIVTTIMLYIMLKFANRIYLKRRRK